MTSYVAAFRGGHRSGQFGWASEYLGISVTFDGDGSAQIYKPNGYTLADGTPIWVAVGKPFLMKYDDNYDEV